LIDKISSKLVKGMGDEQIRMILNVGVSIGVIR
jgi:hypothetical protein